MAYFKDLTEYRYTEEPKPGLLNVGWLGRWHFFKTGETSHAFQAALRDLCENHAFNFCCATTYMNFALARPGMIPTTSRWETGKFGYVGLTESGMSPLA
jgi:hypothetical protein